MDRKVAGALTMAFVCWTIYGKYAALRAAHGDDGDPTKAKTPAKMLPAERKPKRMSTPEAATPSEKEATPATEATPTKAKKRSAKAD